MKKTTQSNCRALRLLAAALLLLTVSVSANAYSFSATNNGVTIYYNRSGSNAIVTYKSTSYNSYSGEVAIPETVTYNGSTYTVTEIGDYAFRDCTGLTEITIPNSVTSIDSYAFRDCSGLTSVTIPNSVTSIGSSAFDRCDGLTSVTIGNSVTTIGNSAFMDCTGLTGELTIPSSVTEIGRYAFWNCSSLTSVIIPESVTTIGSYSFSGCTGLTKFEVAEGNEYYCSVDGVLFTKDMTTLIQFPAASSMTSYDIPNSVTSIDYSAFSRCTGLTSVIIPESVTTIGGNAFSSCSGLTQVNYNAISCMCNSEGVSVFEGCDKLTTINIGENVRTIPTGLCGYLNSLISITIPNSVNTIGYMAFYQCTGLTGTLTIPESVTAIGDYAFFGCTGLTQFDVADGNEYYCAVDGVLFTKDMTTLIQFPASSSLTSYTIPNSVTSIGSSAFDRCDGLTSVTIGNSVTTIGNSAFYQCTGLTSVTIPESVTSIGSYAFQYCTGLTDVTFEDGEETLTMTTSSSNTPFTNCPIKTVYLGRNLSFSNSSYSAFRNNTSLTTLTIGNSVTSIGDSAFYGCTGLIDVTFEDGEETLTMTTSSSNTPFTNCPIETVYLGRNLSFSSSSYSAFRNNTSLASLTIGEKVTNIPDNAFYGCSGLYSISNTSVTQTTCKMRITNNISGAESGVYYNYSFYSVDDDGCCTITGLSPSTSYSYYFGIKLDNSSSSRHGGSISVTTTSTNPKITQVSLTPESLTVIGSYTAGDAEVTATGFTGEESDGVTLYLTNLEPKTQYTVEYYVTASGKKVTTSEKFTTPAVDFTTLPAKATSNTVALIGATTNLSDDAVGAGFEWRRNDAPSTMPSNQAECPVIDGELTGTLNGLSATTYYDFRPYYTSQGGKTYYGDWVTFITADAYVYFEPTVRTYSATSVGSSSATVKAYAVAGSDNITSQGFEYWQGGSSSAMNVRRASTTDENGVTRVEVSGQWMTATFEDLEPSTTYSYRAYVTTAVGTTYGETMSFTTDVPTGIEATTLTEEAEVYEIARYTLDGKKISKPVRGINIIRYSDGTAKKVLVK